jgi:hypothetical protein
MDIERAGRYISESLAGNTHLKKLQTSTPRFDTDKLLCDVSSIESILNSNHTPECIRFPRHRHFNIPGHELSTLAKQCLLLNSENEDKAKVIRKKIMRHYFVREFDVSPSVKMPLSVLPEVMSQIEGDDKQSAIIDYCSAFLNCPMFQNVHLLNRPVASDKRLARFASDLFSSV